MVGGDHTEFSSNNRFEIINFPLIPKQTWIFSLMFLHFELFQHLIMSSAVPRHYVCDDISDLNFDIGVIFSLLKRGAIEHAYSHLGCLMTLLTDSHSLLVSVLRVYVYQPTPTTRVAQLRAYLMEFTHTPHITCHFIIRFEDLPDLFMCPFVCV